MPEAAENLAQHPAEDGLLRYEQPLTERMRTFLRIEFLFEQALCHCKEPTDHATRAAVGSLLEILTILGRGDVRTDVLKDLERQAEVLGRYRRTPGVDTRRLDELIERLSALRGQLAEAGPQFMNPLKECEFLSTIKHRSSIPGGTCVFDLPDYGYWLHLPHKERQSTLEQWVDKLRPVCDGIGELLWLTRETSQPTETTAAGGMYQQNLPRTEQFSLVRILLPARRGIFPEISAGQHRFTVRFVRWRGVDSRPNQASQDVQFLLALA
ncbi:MAG TPA: cell division protein ZapD [Gammaproteobacteria bacterium]|nr:cell division protein ZapD [Gammaproteobacteria bacterium]